MIQVSSRGNLYAPNMNTCTMWMSTIATMKFEPHPCSARMNHPSSTSRLSRCRLFHASPADGTYKIARRIPVTICSMKTVSAALPKT